MMKLMLFIPFFFTLFAYANEPITPIPQSIAYDKEKALLGKKLFFDTILSKDKTLSCASCHSFLHGGADGRKVSIGVNQAQGVLNSPTVFNAVFNFSQFWNGRAKDLNEQALGPIHNPIEMGLSLEEAVQRLQQDTYYHQAFMAITKKSTITQDDLAHMIAEFEKTLITPNSKFDRYLMGKETLNEQELKGYTLFKTLGCITCHNGVNIGANSYQKMGSIIPLERDTPIDDRYAITKREMDKNVFKVPTLRNIALTAPYFHDGSVPTLYEAITKMLYHNLGIELTNETIDALVAFLNTLTGDIPSGDQ
ncbi:MAG: cytochrome-c peroxidase [Sulfurospirillaceae bacterium]|nr:cytochrome-c peroxidase [Sulfurospirillaceae bacterium]